MHGADFRPEIDHTTTMKFTQSALALLFLTSHATAWSRPTFARSAVTLFSTATTSTEQVGEAATESFRLKFKEGGSVISPWHDIPLKDGSGNYNMVRRRERMCEWWTQAFTERNLTLPLSHYRLWRSPR